jgi:alpha-tubulin suppressor-like RCC1 family protein
VRASGEVACWGDNDHGQLGDGTVLAHAHPEPVKGITDARAVATGYKHACALRATGKVTCWGSTASGAIGTYDTAWLVPPVGVTW